MERNRGIRISHIRIEGFKALRVFETPCGPIEVVAGANGVGKSTLMTFLRFFRNGCKEEIPPEIVPTPVGQSVFSNGCDSFSWRLTVDNGAECESLEHSGEVRGPIGNATVSKDVLLKRRSTESELEESLELPYAALSRSVLPSSSALGANTASCAELALRHMTRPHQGSAYHLRQFAIGWRFYSGFSIADRDIRLPAVLEQKPLLREDGSNLSSVLFYLMTEHPEAFAELQDCMKRIVPRFGRLSVKACGGPGQVLALWRERGSEIDLSLADLSDGILRLLCWLALCLDPEPPSLIAVDEPELGLHPRALPLLAAQFQRASERTQVLLATHSSYFLSQFDLDQVAIMRMDKDILECVKPADSAALRANIAEFGAGELEAMHRSDEIEIVP